MAFEVFPSAAIKVTASTGKLAFNETISAAGLGNTFILAIGLNFFNPDNYLVVS
jgi:hypothetical protein